MAVAARDLLLAHAEPGPLVAGEVHAVERAVLAHVADEVGQLEGHAEAGEALGGLARRAQQRGHDPPDRGGAPVHVAVELVPAADPHRAAVDPHRVHVGAQLAPAAGRGAGPRRTSAAMAGSSEPAAGHRRPEVLLAGGRAPRARGRVGSPAGPVHQLVGRAHEGVQGVHRGADLGGKPPGGEVVGGIVAAVQAAAGRVGGAQLRSHALGTNTGSDPVIVAERAGAVAAAAKSRPMRNRALHDALRTSHSNPPGCCAKTRPRAPSWSSTSTRAAALGPDALPLHAAHPEVHRRPLAAAAHAADELPARRRTPWAPAPPPTCA